MASSSSSRLDQAGLPALLEKQRGVISRQQALAFGLTDAALLHRLGAGRRWRNLLPGVYLTNMGAPTTEQQEMAALLYAGPQAVLTGPAALRRHGLRTSGDGIVDVLVPRRCRRKGAAYARLHRTVVMPEIVCVDRGISFALPARAVADTVRALTNIRDARALVAQAVQTNRCRVDLIADELRRGPVRGSAILRQVLAEVGDGVRSAAEGDLYVLLKRSRLPMPMFNPRLFSAGTFIASPDAWWPRYGVAVEVESREWHLSPDTWERTLERDARMSKYGIIVLHFTPRQIRTQPQSVLNTIKDALSVARGRAAPVLRAAPAR